MADETELGKLTRAWIQKEADLHYGGSWAEAACAKLEAAYVAAHAGQNLWAEVWAEQYIRAGLGSKIRVT